MSDFSSGSSHPSYTGTRAADGATVSSWRNVLRNVFQQSRWIQNRQDQQNLAAAPNPISPHPSPRRKWWPFAVFGLLAIVVTLIVTARYVFGPGSVKRDTAKAVSSGGSLLGLTPTTKKLKPSPAKPIAKETPQAQLPPSPWISAPPAPPVQLNTPMPQVRGAPPTSAPPPPPMPNAAPTQPTNTAKAPIAPMIYRARHDKRFGGCLGQLKLSNAGLVFDCPSDPNDSFQVALNEIGAVDENGIRLLSGKKYHFSVSGMSRSAEENLFLNWLHQVR